MSGKAATRWVAGRAKRRGSAEEPPQILADVTRLRTEVGFTPRYDLEVGLQQTIDWWRGRG